MANLFKKHRESIAVSKTTLTNKKQKTTHTIGTDELLNADLVHIKQTEKSARDMLKEQLIRKYQEVFDSACKAVDWTDNRLIFWNIIWRFDVGDIASAFAIAKVAIERGLNSDAKVFKSTFTTVVADTIFKWADAQYKAEATTRPFLDEMIELLKNGLDIHPIPHAKLLKLHGDIIKPKNPTLALAHFTKAQELDETIGVKGRIKELNKTLTSR